MALINCPECGKEISDKSQSCIHCGYPIQQQPEKMKNVIARYPDGDVYIKARNLTMEEAISKREQLEHSLKHPKSGLIIDVDIKYEIVDYDDPICNPICKTSVPSCPRCGSTSISTGARGVNHFWGFIGASKTVNRCAKCGHMWEPKG